MQIPAYYDCIIDYMQKWLTVPTIFIARSTFIPTATVTEECHAKEIVSPNPVCSDIKDQHTNFQYLKVFQLALQIFLRFILLLGIFLLNSGLRSESFSWDRCLNIAYSGDIYR